MARKHYDSAFATAVMVTKQPMPANTSIDSENNTAAVLRPPCAGFFLSSPVIKLEAMVNRRTSKKVKHRLVVLRNVNTLGEPAILEQQNAAQLTEPGRALL